ncbi:hypothetical protein Sjap_003062 [Stephania japonica]|uniref:Uncharacterized protein n=1 Tax=Stephania japonica TaxID=461633 RepID=A0AAP0KQ69_9MAGN
MLQFFRSFEMSERQFCRLGPTSSMITWFCSWLSFFIHLGHGPHDFSHSSHCRNKEKPSMKI